MGKVLKIQTISPITIGAFRLTSSSLSVTGHPSFGEYQGIGDFIQRAHKASGLWLADWIAYGDSRSEWAEQIEAVLGIEEYAEATVRQYRYIAKRFPPSTRIDAVPFGHHAAVVELEPDDQHALLIQARDHGWTQSELRREKHALTRRLVLEGQADTMHTVDLTVRVSLEAGTPYAAETEAWDLVKRAITGVVPHAHVIAAKAQPHVGSTKVKKRA